MRGLWVAKAAVQKGISVLPRSQDINYLFQKYVTRGTRLTDHFVTNRLEVIADHIGNLREYGSVTAGYRALELGTGWFPFVPVCLFLDGAEHIVTADLEELGEFNLTIATIDRVLDEARSGRLAAYLTRIDEGRLRELTLIGREAALVGRDRTLERLRIERVLGDARRLPFDTPVDLITSNHVFEHIPADVLEGLLVEFSRVSHPGTVQSHLIDMCDHYAYMGEGVSTYNFLRFTERAWSLIDNSVQPMNRLRISDYRAIYARAGVPITVELLGGSPEDVDVPLAPPFDAMPLDEVAVNRAHLVSVM